MPQTFGMCEGNVLLLFFLPSISSQLSIYKAAGLWRENKEGGQKNTSAYAEILHTSRLSYLPWGSPVRSPGIQAASTPASPSKYRAVLLQKELACPSKSLENIAIALRVQVCWSNSSIPAGCWLAIDCCYLCQCKTPQLVSNTKGSDQDLYWTIQPITSFFIKNLIVAVLCIQWLVSKWRLWLISIFITWALFLYLWQRFLLVMITLHSPK